MFRSPDDGTAAVEPACEPAPVRPRSGRSPPLGRPWAQALSLSQVSRDRSLHIAHFAHGFWANGVGEQVLALLSGLPRHHPQSVGVLENDGPLRQAVARLGITPREFRQSSGHRLRQGPEARTIEGWLLSEGAEVLHIHDVTSALVAMPAALRLGCPVVLDRMSPTPDPDRTRRASIRWLTRHARHVVVDSAATRRHLIHDEGLPAERISVIPPGFDLDRFDRTARAGLQRPLPDVYGAPVLIHVGGLEDPAGREDTLLDALVRVRQRIPSVQLFLIGEGPRRAALEFQVRMLGLASAVHFLGYRADVPAVMARARLGVRCSADVGRSLWLFEAMATGLPLVASEVGSLPDLLAQGERGWLVPPEQPEALAAALIQALEEPKRAALLGARARAYVARDLDPGRMLAEHEAMYRRLLPR